MWEACEPRSRWIRAKVLCNMHAMLAPSRERHRLRRREPENASTADPEQAAAVREGARGEAVIVCAACAATITGPTHRITCCGSHEHRFLNPAGLVFHIGCFDQAIGCRIIGPGSLEHAWFPGLAWRLALCGQCGIQLGWHFRDGEREGFFGLILNRLRDAGLDG